MEGSVNVMGRKGGNRLFPTLTLTLTFHHPEQSLLHKLHWLDHVIRVGVFSVLARTGTKTYLLIPRTSTLTLTPSSRNKVVVGELVSN